MAESEMGPRDYVNAEFTRRAWQDEAFRDELLRDPRAVVERELGIRLPEDLKLSVHEETQDEIHFILPPRPAALKDAVTGPVDLADRDVQGFMKASEPSTGTSDCHACVGGVRG